MRVGVLTGGGDCPGLNAVIRGVVRRGVTDRDTADGTLLVVRFEGPRAGVVRASLDKLAGVDANLIGTFLGIKAVIEPMTARGGGFKVAQCVTLAELEAMTEAQRLACLLPVDSLLGDHTVVTLDADNAGRFLSGLRRRGPWPDAAQVAVYASEDAMLLGTARVVAGELIPGRLLSPIEIEQMKQSRH